MRFIKVHWPWLFVLVLALLFGAGILLNPLPLLPEGFYAAAPAEEPPPEETEPLLPAPLKGSVTVLRGGEPLFTLEEAGEAVRLLEALLQEAAVLAPEGETLVRAAFVYEMELRDAVHGEEPIPVEEAQRLLAGDAALCPVRVTTRSFTLSPLSYETEETKDERLPKGSRMLLQAGRNGEALAAQENTYIGGEAENKKPGTVRLEPLMEKVAVGQYQSEKPEGEPGRREGGMGKDAAEGFALDAPVRGGISSNFGTRKGDMHHGLDYEAAPGDVVKAPASGTVQFARERGSYGFLLEIDHGGGFVTRISPLADCALSVGDAVEQGQELGKLAPPVDEDVEPHLHMELLIDGIPHNPRLYMD